MLRRKQAVRFVADEATIQNSRKDWLDFARNAA